MGLVKLGTGTSSSSVSERGHNQHLDVESVGHRGLLSFPGVYLEKGKNTLFFFHSVMRSCRQEVSVWFPAIAIFFTSSLVYLWNVEPQNTLPSPSHFPPKKGQAVRQTQARGTRRVEQHFHCHLLLPPPQPVLNTRVVNI